MRANDCFKRPPFFNRTKQKNWIVSERCNSIGSSETAADHIWYNLTFLSLEIIRFQSFDEFPRKSFAWYFYFYRCETTSIKHDNRRTTKIITLDVSMMLTISDNVCEDSWAILVDIGMLWQTLACLTKYRLRDNLPVHVDQSSKRVWPSLVLFSYTMFVQNPRKIAAHRLG